MIATRPRSRYNVIIVLVLAVGAVILAGIAALAVLILTTLPAQVQPSGPAPASLGTAYAADPYDEYLLHAPRGAPFMTREDALTRAYLGCGQTFAPGTVDAALAAAYRGICLK
jgi:hypothetical protein